MSLGELKILLALNGGKRLPYMEEEIFLSSRKIVQYYLYFACCDTNHSEETEIDRQTGTGNIDIEWYIFMVSMHTMQKRWPAAEEWLRPTRVWAAYSTCFKVK